MTKTEESLCTIAQLRECIRRRIADYDEEKEGDSYWDDAVGPKHAEEAVVVCDRFIHDEAQLERILVARKCLQEPSTDLFFEQVRFRARYRPLEIDPQSISNALPSGAWRRCGYSKDGHVISNFKLKLWDPHTYDEDLDEAVEEYTRYVLYMIELMIGSMKDHQQFMVIFDLSGFSVSLVFQQKIRLMIRRLIYVAQAQYPERLYKALLINAPYGFETAWRMISPLLDEKTASKIHFCGKDKLTKDIDPVVLSVEYGGTHPEYPVPSLSLKDELEVSRHSEDLVNAS